MAFLIEMFWAPLLLALLLGLIVGWSTCSQAAQSWSSSWLPFAIIAFLIALFAAVQMSFPGRFGLWLECGLLMFASYMAGCCIGCALRTSVLGSDGIAAPGADSSSYAMTVAGISAAQVPVNAPTVPYGSTPDTETAAPRTYALRSSGADYTMMVAGLNTTAAHTIASSRNPDAEAEAARRRAGAKRVDTYTLATAAINTLAGRSGVDTILHPRPAAETISPSPATGRSAAIRPPLMPKTQDSMTLAVAGISTLAGRDGVDSLRRLRHETVVWREPAIDAAPAELHLGIAALAELPAVAIGAVPELLFAPRNGLKDDLTLIWGVAGKLSDRLNRMGIWHFDQIAAWTEQHVAWFEGEVEGFKGRIERDKWIEQCRKLATGWRPDSAIGERPKE